MIHLIRHPLPIFILYLSVLTYTYLYSISSISFPLPPLIYLPIQSFSPQPKYLTPHVLSEWMVEVWCFELVDGSSF
jgi:hypothetical protein